MKTLMLMLMFAMPVIEGAETLTEWEIADIKATHREKLANSVADYACWVACGNITDTIINDLVAITVIDNVPWKQWLDTHFIHGWNYDAEGHDDRKALKAVAAVLVKKMVSDKDFQENLEKAWVNFKKAKRQN